MPAVRRLTHSRLVSLSLVLPWVRGVKRGIGLCGAPAVCASFAGGVLTSVCYGLEATYLKRRNQR